jgi:hypothetical protein
MLEKSRPLTSDITRKKSVVLKSPKDKKEIRILQADKANCMVVLDESTYKENISSLLESGSHVSRGRYRSFLTKDRTVLPAAMKHKLTP